MYVAFEGVDCVGKSTQITLLKPVFKEAVFVAEPGGTALGLHLRKLLLTKPYELSKKSEFLLFLAARAQLYEEFLKYNQNRLIISDRSFISGMAYTDFDKDLLFMFNNFALQGFFPKKIIFLKGTKELIASRLSQKNLDNIEQRGIEYFLKVQENLCSVLEFLQKEIALEILSLDAQESVENLHTKIKEFIND